MKHPKFTIPLHGLVFIFILLLSACATPTHEPLGRADEALVDIAEDENLPFDPTTFDPTDLFPPVGTPPSISSGHEGGQSFRAATWNLKTWFNGKENQLFTLTSAAGRSGIDTLFHTLNQFGIDIIALQEVYATPANFQVPAGLTGRYDIHHGQVIFAKAGRSELCPIVWDKNLMTCTGNGGGLNPGEWTSGISSAGRDVHWVHCTITANPSANFYFGCAHFSPKTAARDNIQDFFNNLANRGKRPSITGAGGPGGAGLVDSGAAAVPGKELRDNFIMGLDANSHPEGHYGTSAWRAHRDTFNTAVGATPSNEGQQLVPFSLPTHVHPADMGVPANRPFSKIYKRGAGIYVTKKDNKRTIDDLISAVRTPVERIPNTKQILPVLQLAPLPVQNSYNGVPPPPNPQLFWGQYEAFSDHLPISEDYRF